MQQMQQCTAPQHQVRNHSVLEAAKQRVNPAFLTEEEKLFCCMRAYTMHPCMRMHACTSITVIETKAHESVMGLQEGHENSEVGRAPRQGLYIYVPFIWVKTKCFLSALNA